MPAASPPPTVPRPWSAIIWARPRPLWVRKAAPEEKCKQWWDVGIFVRSHRRPQQVQVPMTVEPFMVHSYHQNFVHVESACHPRARCIRCQRPKQPLPTMPSNQRVRFSRGWQTHVRAAASLADTMAIYATIIKDRSGKGLALEGLAISRALCPKRAWQRARVSSFHGQKFSPRTWKCAASLV
jgi:hypothetical protein